MVNARVETLVKIKRFIEEAKKTLKINKVILYGSQAYGHVSKWSDIDLAIISNDFQDIDFHQRMVELGKIAWTAKTTEIEALGFTEDEYQNAGEFDFIREIKKSGKIVA